MFRGGPLDGQFRELPGEPPFYEVWKPIMLANLPDDPKAELPRVTGVYELWPKHLDDFWMFCRMYVWKGWR